MNENVDKERDKRSFLCRQVIQQTLSYPVRPTIRPRRTLAQEIAFAKEIILPGHPHPRTAVRTKVERQVRCEHESINPMDKGASTSNSETRTMYLSDKDYHKWKVSTFLKHWIKQSSVKVQKNLFPSSRKKAPPSRDTKIVSIISPLEYIAHGLLHIYRVLKKDITFPIISPLLLHAQRLEIII